MDAKPSVHLRSPVAILGIGVAALALLTRLCLGFEVSFATVGYIYLIAIAVLSLLGRAASSAFLCLVAVASLNYFFAEPRYSFRVADPDQVIELIGLVVAAFIVILLVRRGRGLADRAIAAEQQAQSAAARLRDVFDRVPALNWSMAPDGSNLVANARFREFTGTSADRGAHILAMPAIHPDDRALEEWRAALEAGRYFEKEVRLRRADGEYRRFQLRFLPHEDDQGRVIEWYGAGSDFEERRRAEEAVAEQARLLDLTHDTVFVRDEKNVIRYWNRAAQELYGWTSEQAVGKVKQELLRTVFPVPLDDINAELHRTGRWEGELVHTKRDGTRVVVASRWSLHRDADGRLSGVLETNNDVTARKAAEDILRGQARLLDQTHDAVITWRLGGAIAYWNLGAEKLYGFSPDEALGRKSHDLLETEHPMPVDLFEAMLERDGAWIGELTHRTRDGRKVIVDSRQALLREPDGTTIVMETNRDITERNRAAEALQDAQAALAHVMRVAALSEVTASLAHEVNQPLAAIANNANACLGLLPDGREEVREVREALADVVRDAERASAVIDRVRDFARRTPEDRAAVQLGQLMNDVVLLVSPESRGRDVRIEVDVDADLPAVAGDRVQLQQVLFNLLMNGMDAMSTVDVRERILRIGGRAETRDGRDFARISVTDAGEGLDPDDADKLFEAFYTTKPRGMGLGLAISRSIVEAHGGELWAESNAGPGATFSFRLPAAAAAIS